MIPHLQIGPRFYLYDFEEVLAALGSTTRWTSRAE
jgi:hypothetical protein